MKIGIGFDGFTPMADVVHIAQQFEAAGADSLWFLQHMGYREAIVMAAAVATSTSRIGIVPAAVSPYLWHPVATAMSIASIAELAPGRVEFCISVGNLKNLGESGVEAAKPVVVMREYVEAIRVLWSGEPVRQEGLFHTLDGPRLAFTPPGRLKIHVASTGPQVLRMAGVVADGILLSGGLTTGSCREHMAFAREAAAAKGSAAGRPHVAGLIYLATGNDGAAARKTMKKKLAFLFRSPMQAANIRSSGLPIDHEAIMETVMKRQLDAAADMLPDDAVDAFAVAGTLDQCKRRLQDYLDVGIDELVLEISGDAAERLHAMKLLQFLRSV